MTNKRIPDTEIPVPPPEIADPNLRRRIADPLLVGRAMIDEISTHVSLHSKMSVLDVGCGVGRMAVAFSNLLREGGSYEGFDIDRRRVEWCQENITSKYPWCRFRLAELYNGAYNPDSGVSSNEFIFPYPEGSFDFVYLHSVFTHMLPADVGNYLSQISRVLKSGGVCWITYLCMDDSAQEVVLGNPEHHLYGLFRTDDGVFYYREDVPSKEAQVAYAEDWIRQQYEANSIDIEKVIVGSWRKLPSKVSEGEFRTQDIFIGRKPGEC